MRKKYKSQLSVIHMQPVFRHSAAALLVTLGTCLMLASAVHAQPVQQSLWRILDSSVSNFPALPAYASQAVPIELAADILESLHGGQSVSVPVHQLLGSTEYTRLLITAESFYVNGDRTLRGELAGYSDATTFVLTASALDVFAYAEIAQDTWQLQASRNETSGNFRGWIYQSEGLPHATLNQDYVIPERTATTAVALPELPPKTLPLRLGNAAALGDESAARIAGINAGNLQINQMLGTGSVLAGGAVEVVATFRNISSERHEALSVNFYFVLDNTSLVSAPSGCRQGTIGGQKVLNCPLGDFNAGESKLLRYTIATTSASKPRAISTALVGDLRHDAVLNVVEDVVKDSDGNGISDFNEALLASNPSAAGSSTGAQSVIDVMALYTPGADTLYGGAAQTRINQLIALANQTYADSDVQITLRPVYMGVVNYPEKADMDTALSDLTNRKSPAFTQVDRLREQYGADLVMLFRPQGNETDRCGLANLGGFRTQGDFQSSNEKQFAFSTIAIDCPVTSVVAHELGHNMGLTHSHLEDGHGGTFPFATGYGVDSLFTTVMAYPGAFNTTARISRFSSPARDCLGVPCGVDANDLERGADAVRALNLVRHQIALYFPIRVPLLPDKSLETLTGVSTNARIALAASLNKGLNYVSAVTPADSIDVNVSLKVDSRHTGRAGAMYVLATLDGDNFVVLDEKGGIHSWDGSFAGLRAFRSVAKLQTVEYMQIVNAARLGKEFVDRRLQIYIAYSVPALGEIVYTVEPMALDIRP